MASFGTGGGAVLFGEKGGDGSQFPRFAGPAVRSYVRTSDGTLVRHTHATQPSDDTLSMPAVCTPDAYDRLLQLRHTTAELLWSGGAQLATLDEVSQPGAVADDGTTSCTLLFTKR